MSIFRSRTKSKAEQFFDALWNEDIRLATKLKKEMISEKAREIWLRDGFELFFVGVEWEEIDAFNMG